MALRGALQLSRLRMMKAPVLASSDTWGQIDVPEFSKSRFARRVNMMDEAENT